MFKRSQYPLLPPPFSPNGNGGWRGTVVAFFLPPLCCWSRQSKIRLAEQTGATDASQRTMTHLEHSRKDFNSPNPSPAPTPATTTNSLFLIAHYPVPVSGRECRKYLQAARPELMWGVREQQLQHFFNKSGLSACDAKWKQMRNPAARLFCRTSSSAERGPVAPSYLRPVIEMLSRREQVPLPGSFNAARNSFPSVLNQRPPSRPLHPTHSPHPHATSPQD